MFSSNDYNGAARVFSQLSCSHPAWAEARIQLGRTLVEQKRFEDAIECCMELVRKDIDSYRGYFCCGNICLMYTKDYERAIEYFDLAIQQKTDQSGSYLSRGAAYEKKQDHEKAFADFDKAIELEPKKDYMWYRRGKLYLSIGNYDRAIENFDQAIAIIRHTNPSYHLWRGFARHRKEQYDLAFEDYCKTINITPYYDEAFAWRGLIYGEKGLSQLAAADFNFALKKNPTNGYYYFYRGINYLYELGKYDLAFSDLIKAIELAPDHTEFQQYLDVLYEHMEYGTD